MQPLSTLAVLLLLGSLAAAQSPSGGFTAAGSVVDPTGAGIPNAQLKLQRQGASFSRTTRSDGAGTFRLSGLPSGDYTLDVTAGGFSPAVLNLRIDGHDASAIRCTLQLAGVRQEVTVSDDSSQVTTQAAGNLDAVTLDRALLDDLPVFDQNYVAAMTQFLDPGSVGTNGVTLVVNGMEQRNIGVSASAIQQVKINQNPYSAEFSRPGRGRIEVLTKPGGQSYHGTFNFLYRDAHLNARDPFSLVRAPEQRRIYEGSLFGPLGRSGKNSFFLSANRQEQDLQSVVYASTPAGLFQANIPNPQRDTEVSAGVTHQFSDGHIASFRVSYHNTTDRNRGVGGFVLPEAGVNYQDREDELYYNDSLVISSHLLNQFRIVFGRQHTPTSSVTQAPGLNVAGSFVGGGAQADRLQTENHVNVNEILTWTAAKHELRVGINIPDISRRGLNDYTNLAGTYSFSTLADFQQNRPYSLIRQAGDGHVVFVEGVAGGFIQDEYHLRPNVTISAGLRYDWQNFLHDRNNFSPRVALAFAPTKDRKTVLRVGGGLFYDRTGPGPLFDLKRYNGLRMRQAVITNPTFPFTLPGDGLAAFPTSIVRFDPSVQLPYTAQFSAVLERQVRKGATLSISYWATRGVGLFRSRDVNAPPPPLYDSRPNPSFGLWRQIESSGHLQGDALEVAFRGRITKYFSGMAQYTLGRTYNDVPGNYSASTRGSGINAYPANNYDLSGEWGRADYDQRHRFNLLGSTHAARYLDLGIGLALDSGSPYTMTTGRDDYHTGFANARPPGVTRNTLQGPRYLQLDLRWFHDFVLTTRKDSPAIRISVDAFNVTNRVNYASYVGNLSSPFFGQAVSSRPPRRLQVSARFSF
ncbi:MAG: TonB-dependent receptor [Acidobacteria bacterium]|nr:TonB-dependent receptor [Acidobacteriota bacterium]